MTKPLPLAACATCCPQTLVVIWVVMPTTELTLEAYTSAAERGWPALILERFTTVGVRPP